MHTALRKKMGIEFPIFAFSHCRDVVAAVSKAGGFGVLGVTGMSPQQLNIELDWIEKEVGDHPYGVDILIPAKMPGKEKGGLSVADMDAMIPEGHKRFLDELLEKYGIPPLGDDDRTLKDAMFEEEGQKELIDVAFKRNISLVANALGPPPAWMIERAHAQNVVVAALAGKPKHAQRHVEMGVDIIVAQGTEAGGHTGDVSTMVLVPEIVDVAGDVPVLAAGGIGNGRQIAASLALGAQGVWTGSVWLTTEEAETHPVVKDKFLKAESSDTLRSKSRTGKPARMLRSAWTDAWEDPNNPAPLPLPLQPHLANKAWARVEALAHKNEGAADLISNFVGQIVGSMNAVLPARRVIEEMVTEYLDAVERVGKWTEGDE